MVGASTSRQTRKKGSVLLVVVVQVFELMYSGTNSRLFARDKPGLSGLGELLLAWFSSLLADILGSLCTVEGFACFHGL